MGRKLKCRESVILNCLVGQITKTDDGKVRLSLVDIVGAEYGFLMLNDDFGRNVKKTLYVRLVEVI